MKKDRDVSLDILRVCACIMVFGVHFVQHMPLPGALGAFFEKGSTGVGFFFILSGYLACFSMESVSGKYESKWQAACSFWIKRMARILPLYYIVVLFYMIFFTVIKKVPQDDSGLYWIRYLLFLNTWVPASDAFWINLGAVWSISSFVLFYLIAPLYYYVVQNYLLAWAGVGIGYALMKFADIKGWQYMPIKSLFYFFLGVLIFVAGKKGKELNMLLILCFTLLFGFLTNSGTALIAPFLAAAYILATRKMNVEVKDNSLWAKALFFVSGISYSIYLDHAVVIQVFDNLGMKSGIVYAILLIALTLVLSIFTHKYIEERLGRYIVKHLWRNKFIEKNGNGNG